MINTTKIYSDTDKSKKSPGQWLQSKDVKALVSELDGKSDKNEDGDWFFDELLSKHYEIYLHPKSIQQTSSSKSSYEDLGKSHDFCKKAFLEHISGKSFAYLNKNTDVEKLMSDLPQHMKTMYKAFAYSFKCKYDHHRIREEQAMKYTLQTLISSLRFNVDPQEKLFENDNITIRFRKTTNK